MEGALDAKIIFKGSQFEDIASQILLLAQGREATEKLDEIRQIPAYYFDVNGVSANDLIEKISFVLELEDKPKNDSSKAKEQKGDNISEDNPLKVKEQDDNLNINERNERVVIFLQSSERSLNDIPIPASLKASFFLFIVWTKPILGWDKKKFSDPYPRFNDKWRTLFNSLSFWGGVKETKWKPLIVSSLLSPLLFFLAVQYSTIKPYLSAHLSGLSFTTATIFGLPIYAFLFASLITLILGLFLDRFSFKGKVDLDKITENYGQLVLKYILNGITAAFVYPGLLGTLLTSVILFSIFIVGGVSFYSVSLPVLIFLGPLLLKLVGEGVQFIGLLLKAMVMGFHTVTHEMLNAIDLGSWRKSKVLLLGVLQAIFTVMDLVFIPLHIIGGMLIKTGKLLTGRTGILGKYYNYVEGEAGLFNRMTPIDFDPPLLFPKTRQFISQVHALIDQSECEKKGSGLSERWSQINFNGGKFFSSNKNGAWSSGHRRLFDHQLLIEVPHQ